MSEIAPPWGPLLAVYLVCVGLPSGLTLVTWWLARQGVSGAPAVHRYGTWAAMVSLALISVLLVVDLGRPERFYFMITRFDNPGSPIAVGAKLIAVKMFLLAIGIYVLERRGSSGGSRPVRGAGAVLGGALVVTSFALAVYPAALLARSWGSPLAGSSGSALIFVITALLMGAAAVLLVLSVLPGGSDELGGLLRMSRTALLVLVAAAGVAWAFEVLSLAGRPVDRVLLGQLLGGSFSVPFWGLTVAVGIAVPAAGLLLFPTRRAVLFVSAVATLAGAATARYLLFAVGP